MRERKRETDEKQERKLNTSRHVSEMQREREGSKEARDKMQRPSQNIDERE